MRPIQKLASGTLIKGLDGLYFTIQDTYNPFQKAKQPLIRCIGNYCCFCERPIPYVNLEVEHIQPKGLAQYTSLIYSWSNFLLACKNCNIIKSNQDVVFNSVYLPHLNNTFSIFNFREGGLIVINPAITDVNQRQKIQNLINLVGMDRRPGNPKLTPADDRWQDRKKAWDLAKRYLTKYQNAITDIETIKDLCEQNGFWSIWMTVFQNYPEVKQVLVNEITGTAVHFF